MFKIVADATKNRLYITLGGHLEPEEIVRAAESITREVAKLSPGFDLINDITEAYPTDENGQKVLMGMQKLLVSIGLRRVIRVTKVLLTELQLERISKQAGYHPVIVSSVEKAEKLLDSCVVPEEPSRKRNWDRLRKYRRVAVGPDHSVRFSLGHLELTNVRITNLSAEGCFALLTEQHGKIVREGLLLNDFRMEHEDLPSTQIAAKVVRIVPGLSELSENDIGLGIQFLSTSQQFTEWVDAYVLAYYGLNH